MTARPLAVIDIDGVVADVTHRLHHIERHPKSWPAFFAGAERDPLLDVGAALVAELAKDHDTCWLTGRPERMRRTTTEWLGRHGLPTEPLHMRPRGDHMPARELKPLLLAEIAADREVGIVVDDDPAVVEALRAAGWPVLLAEWLPHSSTLRAAQEEQGRT